MVINSTFFILSSFDDTNLNKLRNVDRHIVKAKMETFFSDLKALDWEDLLYEYTFPWLGEVCIGGCLLRGFENGKWILKY